MSALQQYEADNGDLSSLSTGSWWPSGYGKLAQVDLVWVAVYGQGYHTEANDHALVFRNALCPSDLRAGRTPTSSDAAVSVTLSNGEGYCASL